MATATLCPPGGWVSAGSGRGQGGLAYMGGTPGKSGFKHFRFTGSAAVAWVSGLSPQIRPKVCTSQWARVCEREGRGNPDREMGERRRWGWKCFPRRWVLLRTWNPRWESPGLWPPARLRHPAFTASCAQAVPAPGSRGAVVLVTLSLLPGPGVTGVVLQRLCLLSRAPRSLQWHWVQPSAAPASGAHRRGGAAGQRFALHLHLPPGEQRSARGILPLHPAFLILVRPSLRPVHR